MGKLSDDTLKWTLDVNGNPARNELNKLNQTTYELEQSQKGLRLEREKLASQGKKNTAADKQLAAQMKTNAAQIKKNKDRAAALRKELGLGVLTRKELRSESKRLQNQLNNEIPGTAKYKQLEAQLNKVNARKQELNATTRIHNNTLKSQAGFLQRARARFLGYAIAISTALYSFKALIQGNIGLSDSFADVMKTTGLTRKVVGDLFNDFSKLNTRTARKELLALAVEAGRLGYKSKQDILDFVEAGNQIKIALGDDLGGEAEKAIKQVGKLTNIFKVGEKYGVDFRKAMLMVGSSINEVSANSTAEAGFLIDIMSRMAGVVEHTELAASAVLGYGSVLDQLAQSKEVSGTTLNRVMIDMFKDVSLYADVAGQSTENFLNLLRTDANEAFLTMLEGLNSNNEGFDTMVKKMESLELDGVRATQVLTALAGSVDMIRHEQSLANKALEEGTSLTKEYELRNNNLAGSWEKIGNFLRDKFINSGFESWLDGIVNRFAKWTEIPLYDTLREQRSEANLLINSITSLNEGDDTRLTLLKELNSNYPDILKNMNLEKITNQDLVKLKKEYNDQIRERIKLAVYEEEITEKEEKAKELFKKELSFIKLISASYNKYINDKKESATLQEKIATLQERTAYSATVIASEWANNDDITGAVTQATILDFKINNIKNNVEAYNQNLIDQADIEKEILVILEKKSVVNSSLNKNQSGEGKSKKSVSTIVGFTVKEIADFWEAVSLGIITGEKKVRNLTEEEIKRLATARKKQLESEKKFKDELLRTSKSLLEQEELNFQDRLKKAGLFGKNRETLSKKDLQALVLLETEHQDNIAKLNAENIDNDILLQKQLFDAKTLERITNHNEELIALGNDEEAKKALHAKFNQEELQREKDFYNSLITQIQEALNSGDWDGIDITGKFLSAEKKEELIAKLQELGLEISDINLLLNEDLYNQEKEFTDRKKLLEEELFEKKKQLQEEFIRSSAQLLHYGTQKLYNKELKELNKKHKKEQKDLQDKYDAELITKEKYDVEMDKLQIAHDERQLKLKQKQALRNKLIDGLEVMVDMFKSIAEIKAIAAVLAANPLTAALAPLALAQIPIVRVSSGLSMAMIAAEPIPQAYSGKYDVIGAEDGKKYSAKYKRNARTGLLKEPTVLAGEQPEIIIDPYTTRNLQSNYPEVIDMINFARRGISQAFNGKYPQTSPSTAAPVSDSGSDIDILFAINENIKLNNDFLDKLDKDGVYTNLSMHDLNEKLTRYLEIENSVKD